MATDVNIKPNSPRPGAKATTEIQFEPTPDDISHFNQSNPMPTDETPTTITTEIPKIIDRRQR